jgi:hypothetical protein
MSHLYQKLKKENEHIYIKNFLCDLIRTKSSSFSSAEIKEIQKLRKKLPNSYNEMLLDSLTKIRVNLSSTFWYDILELKNDNLLIPLTRVISQLKDKEELPSNKEAYFLLEKLLNDHDWITKESFEQKFVLINALPKNAFLNTFKIFVSSQYFKKLDEIEKTQLINKTVYHHKNTFFYEFLNQEKSTLIFKDVLSDDVYQKVFSLQNIVGFSFAYIEKLNMLHQDNKHYVLNTAHQKESFMNLIVNSKMSEEDFKNAIFSSQPFLQDIIKSQELNAKQVLESFITHYNNVATQMNYELFDLSKPETQERLLLETQMLIKSTIKNKIKI